MLVTGELVLGVDVVGTAEGPAVAGAVVTGMPVAGETGNVDGVLDGAVVTGVLVAAETGEVEDPRVGGLVVATGKADGLLDRVAVVGVDDVATGTAVAVPSGDRLGVAVDG